MYFDTLDGMGRALDLVRKRFRDSLPDNNSDTDNDLALLFETAELLGPAVAKSNSCLAASSVLTSATRDVLAYWVLMESGCATTAPMCLRRALESLLVAADISHNPDSYAKWESFETAETFPDRFMVDFEAISRDRRETFDYFSAKSIKGRIVKSEDGIYPDELVLLVRGNEDGSGTSIMREWARVSDHSVHVHSPHQMGGAFDGKGGLQVLGRPDTQSIDDARFVLRIHIVLIVSLFWLLPSAQLASGGFSERRDPRLRRINLRLLRARLNIRRPHTKKELVDFMREARPDKSPPSVPELLPDGKHFSRIDVDFLAEPPKLILRESL